MTLLIRLIAKYALWIYVLCGIGMILYLRTALAARKEGGQAVYSLERESAASRIYRSSGMILLLLLIVVGVYALSHYVELPSPTTSPIELPTAAAGTPTPTLRPSTLTPGVSTTTVLPTSTRRPRSTTVAIPTSAPDTLTTATAPASCPHPNVRIVQPQPGQVINDGIQVQGTADKEQFDRYEFKFKSQDTADEWHWVETFRTPVSAGDLGFWRTSHLPPGNYVFMLIAIDRTGNSQECIVPVAIKH